ncbi:MAG TPA: hypothetical protein PLX71_02660, partial [Phycicoccus sp.]|nr:hypothetical protein [Phycicoccus sp.]
YDLLWYYFNFFQPVMRQTEKTHHAGHTRRKHEDVRTPFQRVVASQCVPAERQQQLQAEFESMNPFALKQDLEEALTLLFRLPGAQPGHTEDIFETLEPTLSR